MCSPLGSVVLAPLRACQVSVRALSAGAGLLAADAAALPIQWIYSQDVLREASAEAGGALRFLDTSAGRRLYDDPRVPAGRKMCVTDHKVTGDISVNAEVFLLVAESLAATSGNLNHLDLDKRFFERFGPGGGYVGYVDSALRRKLRLIDIQAEQDCPTRDSSDGEKFMQVLPVGRGETESTTDKVCPFSSSYPEARPSPEASVDQPGSSCPFNGTAQARALESWAPTGVDDAQSPALASALAAGCLYSALPDAELLPRVEAAVLATHANSQASMYGRAAARVLAGVIRGEDITSALAAGAAVPRCPNTARRLRDVLDHGSHNSCAVAKEFGTECHLEMVVPSAFHAILHASSFADGIERTLAAGGDVVGRASLVGSVLAAHFGEHSIAECLERVRVEHRARLGEIMAPESGWAARSAAMPLQAINPLISRARL